MPSADSQDFLWIAVGDIHDEPERFAQIPELSQADGIIVTGDLTITGGVKQAELVMNALCVHDIPVLAQIPIRPEIAGSVDEGTVEYVKAEFLEKAAEAVEKL